MSIKQSLFQGKCKVVKLELQEKKRSKNELKNYRPMSLLLVVSKIMEKTMHIQSQEHLDKTGLLHKYQSVFLQFSQHDYCLVQLKNFILREIDKGFFFEMILIDLQKAATGFEPTKPFSQIGLMIELCCEYYLYRTFDRVLLSCQIQLLE